MKNDELLKAGSIVLGGGCFWCLEALFSGLKGVLEVVSGYAGGDPPVGGNSPTYEEISSGKTGHAETIRISFDPQKISLEDIFSIFFLYHDPTTIDRQGNDVGTQYRSIILYSDEKQKEIAEKVRRDMEDKKIYGQPFVTQIKKLREFYPAENYHQKYYQNNPEKAYCQIVIEPKLQKFKKEYARFMK